MVPSRSNDATDQTVYPTAPRRAVMNTATIHARIRNAMDGFASVARAANGERCVRPCLLNRVEVH